MGEAFIGYFGRKVASYQYVFSYRKCFLRTSLAINSRNSRINSVTQLNQCHFKNQSFSLSNENHLTQPISPFPLVARKPKLNSISGCNRAFCPLCSPCTQWVILPSTCHFYKCCFLLEMVNVLLIIQRSAYQCFLHPAPSICMMNFV